MASKLLLESEKRMAALVRVAFFFASIQAAGVIYDRGFFCPIQ